MNHTATSSRPTFIQRFQRHVAARAEARRNGETGLALLDVLLGMAIFGIIVIIGIQSVNQFRQRAFETTANSDAQQLSVALESYFTDNQTYPATQAAITALFTGTPLTSTSLGVNLSRNTAIIDYAMLAADGDYSYCIVHYSGGVADANIDAWSVYDSARGAIIDSGRGQPTAVTQPIGGGVAGNTARTGVNCLAA